MLVFSLLAALQATPADTVDLTGSEPQEVQIGAPTLEDRLLERVTALAAAPDEATAETIAAEVRSLWRQQAGPTADLLLQRGADARTRGDLTTAWQAYDHLRGLEPDYAEGWIVSAQLAASEEDWRFALEALNEAVTLDALRFDAWALLGQALEQAQAREAAQEAYREAVALYPYHPQAGPALARLDRELAGRAL